MKRSTKKKWYKTIFISFWCLRKCNEEVLPGFHYILWGIRIYRNKTLGLRYFIIFWLRTKEVKWRKKFTLDENLFTLAKFWVAVFKHVTHFRSTGFISDQIKNGTIIHPMSTLSCIHFRAYRLLHMTLCCIPCISIHWYDFGKYITYSYRTLKNSKQCSYSFSKAYNLKIQIKKSFCQEHQRDRTSPLFM